MSRRRSGRTTRMLATARLLAEQGRAVYVVGEDERHAEILAREFDAHFTNRRGVKFEERHFSDLEFQVGGDGVRGRGMHPNCVVLVDHYVCELEVNAIEDQIRRLRIEQAKWRKLGEAYDKPTEVKIT